MFIFLLSSMSVKFYANKLLGNRPPKGAESMTSLMNTAKGQQILAQAGIDADDLPDDLNIKKKKAT